MTALAVAAIFLAADAPQQTIELRVYRNTDLKKQEVVIDFVADALVPALNRHNVGPVGVFKPMEEEKDGKKQTAADLYVLISYDSMESYLATRDALAADDEYAAAARDFFSAVPKNPNYQRCDTSLMRAFAGMPTVEVPALTKGNQDRLFELRTYESHTEEKARLKVDMFNSGEIDVMKEVGLAPVFYGEVLAGSEAPCLKYMMSGPNLDEHKAHFKGFLDHPTWAKLKVMPKYAQTVSKIRKTFLVAARGSQI